LNTLESAIIFKDGIKFQNYEIYPLVIDINKYIYEKEAEVDTNKRKIEDLNEDTANLEGY